MENLKSEREESPESPSLPAPLPNGGGRICPPLPLSPRQRGDRISTLVKTNAVLPVRPAESRVAGCLKNDGERHSPVASWPPAACRWRSSRRTWRLGVRGLLLSLAMASKAAWIFALSFLLPCSAAWQAACHSRCGSSRCRRPRGKRATGLAKGLAKATSLAAVLSGLTYLA